MLGKLKQWWAERREFHTHVVCGYGMTVEPISCSVPVRVKLLDKRARVPKYATPGACAVDLHAVLNKPLRVRPGMPVEIRTGLAFEVAEGWRLELASRSGHGRKFGVRLSNCTGYIDSDYRGEVIVCLTADHGRPGLVVKPGERIAQLMLSWSPRMVFEVVDELSATERGTGGFGSTGRA